MHRVGSNIHHHGILEVREALLLYQGSQYSKVTKNKGVIGCAYIYIERDLMYGFRALI